MATVVLFVATLLSHEVSSAPVTLNRRADSYTSWVSQPNVRGTFGLVLNCLITLSLCVWTAVHLNIPGKPQISGSRLQRIRRSYLLRRTGWVLTGLLAPELVIYTAWMQWSSARLMTKEMKKLLEKVCRSCYET